MKTHDEKTKAHIKSICDAFAEDPESILVNDTPIKAALDNLHEYPFAYSIKPKPLAPGHNPDKLTVDQVGEGWRLLEKDEYKLDRPLSEHIFAWQIGAWIQYQGGNFTTSTYRTCLSREQLALVDKNEGWIPWFGGECPVSGDTLVEWASEAFPDPIENKITTKASKLSWRDGRFGGANIIAYRPTKQPTIIPWTRETIPTLPFEVRHKGTRIRCAVIEADAHYLSVGPVTKYKYADLLLMFTLPDSSPCGTTEGTK